MSVDGYKPQVRFKIFLKMTNVFLVRTDLMQSIRGYMSKMGSQGLPVLSCCRYSTIIVSSF